MVLEKLAGTTAVEIVAIFAFMFVGIVIATLWFTHSSTKITSKKELQKKQMEIIDKHFKEMMRIECPYCSTTYSPNKSDCPNCGANTQKILFPEMPE